MNDDTLRAALQSQYHACVAMLRQAITRCPDELWTAGAPNPFWRGAYHALFYTHLYASASPGAFVPWEGHQWDVESLDGDAAPAEIEALFTFERRPRTGAPYTRAQLLAYCDELAPFLEAAVAEMDLAAPTSGFPWYPISKLEHQLVNLRHVQHHLAQLSDRLRAAGGEGVDWVGRRRG